MDNYGKFGPLFFITLRKNVHQVEEIIINNELF